MLIETFLALLFCLITPMALKSGTSSQACAACKYQRRRCTPECPLAPHFPADQHKIFQNAHRLFGVANMSRILKQIRDDQRDDAMQSIKYESNTWERFPYYGCCAVIWQLRERIQAYQAEVCYVRSLIEMVRNEEDKYCNLDDSKTAPPPAWLQFKQLSMLDPSSTVIRNYDDDHLLPCPPPHYDDGTSYETEMKPLCPLRQRQSRDVHHLLASQDVEAGLVMDDTQEESDLSNGSQMKDRIQSSSVREGAPQNELMNNSAGWFNLTSTN